MAAKPKLTPEEWANARKVWESDYRQGYDWLAVELGGVVSRQSINKKANSEGWRKSCAKVAQPSGKKGCATIKKPDIDKACSDTVPKNDAVIKTSKHGGKREGAGAPLGAKGLLKLSIKERAAEHGEDAVAVMSDIMNDTEVQPQVRLAAAEKLLDRGYGKPKQEVEVSGEVSYVDRAALMERYERNLSKTAEYARQAEERREMLKNGALH
jgi:hypothetical protein